MNNKFDAARSVSLLGVIDRLGIKRKGKSFHCPHKSAHAHGDKSPSAVAYKETWKCHGCGAMGDGADLVKLALGLDSQRAIEWIAGQQVGIIAPKPAPEDFTYRPLPLPEGVMGGNLALLWDIIRLPQSEAEALIADRVDFSTPTRFASIPFRDWCLRRGWHPGSALLSGAVDGVACRDRICGWVEMMGDSMLGSLGLLGDDGRRWWPLRCIESGDHPGALIPVWDPRQPHFPVAYRYRLYEPLREGKLKTVAMPGRRFDVVGCRIHPATKTIIVCEGEPDYLTAFHLICSRVVLGDCAPIGIGGVKTWSKAKSEDLWWARRILPGRRVVVLLHDHGEETQNFCRALEAVAAIRPGGHIVTRLLPESADLNDMWRAATPMPASVDDPIVRPIDEILDLIGRPDTSEEALWK